MHFRVFFPKICNLTARTPPPYNYVQKSNTKSTIFAKVPFIFLEVDWRPRETSDKKLSVKQSTALIYKPFSQKSTSKTPGRVLNPSPVLNNSVKTKYKLNFLNF